MKRRKTERNPGFHTRTVHRDVRGRFVSHEYAITEEHWKYRTAKKTGRIKDLKIESLPGTVFETSYHRSIDIPEDGKRAGKISARLAETIRQLPTARADTHIVITMTARTYHGKKIKRKLDFYHYNSKNLHDHTIGGIIQGLFYDHGDRPAYPVKIVKGWRKRHVTKGETIKRRQLYDVTFNIKAETESRKSVKAKARKPAGQFEIAKASFRKQKRRKPEIDDYDSDE